MIDNSLAVVECRLGDIFDGGDHELVTGHVVAMDVGEGSPLLFYRSGFGRFAQCRSALPFAPMPELIPSTVIDDVVLVRPDVHGDERGRFVETYRRSWFPDRPEMIQGNRSEKQAGAVVGLHFHLHQADYWYALRGRCASSCTTSGSAPAPTGPPR